jgi:hypothetical protein
MYPYVEQQLGHRAGDPAAKLGGLILEVKGDFCTHFREMLARRGRAADYVEISLTSPSPLHNDLDAYALAYGAAKLMTNLFGKSREPFWQQASSNLVKFVILLHKTLDDYVTLFQVYKHVINPDQLRAKIAEGDQRFAAKNRRILVDKRTYLSVAALRAWTWQDEALASARRRDAPYWALSTSAGSMALARLAGTSAARPTIPITRSAAAR